MAHIRVLGATFQEDRIDLLRVEFHRVGARTVDRAQAIAWLREGHSLIPVVAGTHDVALRLVTLDGEDGPRYFVRGDTADEPADRVLGLPPA
jgi:hypothetical protein